MNKISYEVVEKYAEYFRALAHPVRLHIAMELLAAEEGMNVTEIQSAVGVSQSSVSQHLRIIKQSGLLESTRKATMVVYKYKNQLAKDIVTFVKNSMESAN